MTQPSAVCPPNFDCTLNVHQPPTFDPTLIAFLALLALVLVVTIITVGVAYVRVERMKHDKEITKDIGWHERWHQIQGMKQ